ncbi:hypothetical protein PENSUB_1521 [Penicillium subrubescens]|uniref:BZIP domain-containing protein n=1 Tax=Penicillium subrubescens TaxID=1316194 RepID=A0A1Q5UK08_9EURO|nr:hypothetical protein PENSUB_1521 [Penicillium subrubescens]
MSANLHVPETSSNNLSGSSGDCERSSLNSDNLHRLRTGKRGRPRIDPSQNGLVERRRNQVRKAQRTYRSRKEEEAASRMNYVQVLENRIRHMTQSFLQLISYVQKAEIAPGQSDPTHELHNITRDFLSSSQIIEHFSESQHDDGYTYDKHPIGDPISPSPVGFANIHTSCPTELPLPATIPIETSIHAPLHQTTPRFLEAEVPIPNNFAQRLYSTCIKRAHGLLTDPFADGDEVARVFQYSFYYSDVNTMISTFDILLQTNADYQLAYVYQVGGAGTHYKKRQPAIDIAHTASLGPDSSCMSNDETWFDPRDIEGWLEENGLVIGGEQSFMYLSEIRSFESYKDMTLCPEAAPSLSSHLDVRKIAKVLDVNRFLQGSSSSLITCN